MFNNTWFSSSASGLSDKSGEFFLEHEAPGIGSSDSEAYTLPFGNAFSEPDASSWASPRFANGAAPLTLRATLGASAWSKSNRQAWLVFAAAAFLVSVPVFVQAPLVRQLPLLSLVMTLGWIWLGLRLFKHPATQIWGDLLLGFSWSWLAGSIYWGWLRWEPLIHLPVEAIGLPFALWSLWRGWGMIGNLFYLGSLFGTALTDIYFYVTDLIPHWRQVMRVDPALATPIFQSAIAQVQTPWGISWAVMLVGTLLVVGLWALVKGPLHWWAFSGAVLSTILVDSLFWLAASMV